MILFSSSDFFLNELLQKKSVRNIIRVSNDLDLDQDRHSHLCIFEKIIIYLPRSEVLIPSNEPSVQDLCYDPIAGL